MEWGRTFDGYEGAGKTTLPWKYKIEEVSRTIQLRLRARVCRFPRIFLGLGAGRIDLIQDICVAGLGRTSRGKRENVRFVSEDRLTLAFATACGSRLWLMGVGG